MAQDFYVHRAAGFETPGGVRWPVRPKDTIGIPTNPRIQATLQKWECTAKVVTGEKGQGAYDVINKHGDAIELPFGAPEADWEDAAEQLAKHRD